MAGTCSEGPALELDAESCNAIAAAVSLAVKRHDAKVHGTHLIAVLNRAGGALERLLMQFGGTQAQLMDILENWLQFDNAEEHREPGSFPSRGPFQGVRDLEQFQDL